MRANKVLPLMLASAAWSSNASADSPMMNEFIPASACQVEDAADIGVVELDDGSWILRGDEQVALICPVRIPPFFIQGNTLTNLFWSRMEIFFQDPDGQSTGCSVEAELFEVPKVLAPISVITLSSDSMNVNITTDRKLEDDIFPSPWFIDEDALYFVRVVMTTDGEQNDVLRFSRVKLYTTAPGSP